MGEGLGGGVGVEEEVDMMKTHRTKILKKENEKSQEKQKDQTD